MYLWSTVEVEIGGGSKRGENWSGECGGGGIYFLFPFEVAVCQSTSHHAAQVPEDFTNTCAVASVRFYESSQNTETVGKKVSKERVFFTAVTFAPEQATKVERGSSYTLSSTSALDGMGCQRHAPTALPLWKTRCPLNMRLCGTPSRSGQVRQNSPLHRDSTSGPSSP